MPAVLRLLVSRFIAQATLVSLGLVNGVPKMVCWLRLLPGDSSFGLSVRSSWLHRARRESSYVKSLREQLHCTGDACIIGFGQWGAQDGVLVTSLAWRLVVWTVGSVL